MLVFWKILTTYSKDDSFKSIGKPLRYPTWKHQKWWSFSGVYTAQKMKFSMKNLCIKYDQILRKLGIWSHLLKKFLIIKLHFLYSVKNKIRLRTPINCPCKLCKICSKRWLYSSISIHVVPNSQSSQNTTV